MKFLHTSLKTAHSGCKPSTFMSLSTHSFQIFLFLPLHLDPATSTFLQADTQSSTLLRSRCPNHLNLPRHTLYTQTTNPHYVSYPSATPRTSISPSSILSSPDYADLLSSSCRFQSHMSSCQHTLDTSLVALCLSL